LYLHFPLSPNIVSPLSRCKMVAILASCSHCLSFKSRHWTISFSRSPLVFSLKYRKIISN
jgi:hypothetical protein